MQECRDESEIDNYQRIQLLNNKFINGVWWGVRLSWLDCKEAILGLFFHLEIEEISISENKRNLR